MDNDTPRYGSRHEDDAPRRQTDDPPASEERISRPSFLDTPRDDDTEGSSFARNTDESRPARNSFRSDQGAYGDLESLRPSRAISEPPTRTERPASERSPYGAPPARDNGGYGFDSDSDDDRGSFRPSTSTASSFDRSEQDSSNPLLRSEPPEPRKEPSSHRFSWEDPETERPAPRQTYATERDYEPPRHSARNSRLDRLNARADARPRSEYGADRGYEPTSRSAPPAYEPSATPSYERPSDTGYDRPADTGYDRPIESGYDRPTEPSYERPAEPAYQPPARARGYNDAPQNYQTDDYYDADQQRGYEPYEAAAYQGAHARELADVDETYARDYRYQSEDAEFRQGYDEYGEDFQQYDDPYDQPPQKRKRGPFLLLGSLVAVAAIAGGLIFFYQSTQSGNEPEIPVVTTNEEPVKIEPPAPEPAPVTPTPRKTKLIYDRIRADDAEPENTLVPRQEEPANPETQDQSNNTQESIDDTIVTPSASNTTDDTDANGSEPLPLPLPPPPVNNAQDIQTTTPTFNTTNENLNTGGSVVENTQDTDTNEPPAPASQDTLAAVQPEPASEPAPEAVVEPIPENLTSLIQSPPLPKEKPVPPSRQAEPGPAVPSGPIQIAPLPGSVDRETTTDDQTANSTQPTQLEPASPVEQATQQPTRRLNSRFSDELNTNDGGNQVAAVPQPAPEQPQVDVETPTPDAPQPEPQLTGGRYLIQLAAFRSQEEAQAEFQKLQTRHPSLLGNYSSLVQQADLGTRGTYYRLRIGPIETRSNASQLCNSLIAAGERDCLVRER